MESNGFVLMSTSEINRIKQSAINDEDDTLKNPKKTEKELLKEKSDARVAKWNNTLEATRKLKEQKRIQKREEEEVSASISFLRFSLSLPPPPPLLLLPAERC